MPGLANSRTPLSPAATSAVYWQGYSVADTDEVVRLLFTRRYGEPPQEIRRETAVVLAGPVPIRRAVRP